MVRLRCREVTLCPVVTDTDVSGRWNWDLTPDCNGAFDQGTPGKCPISPAHIPLSRNYDFFLFWKAGSHIFSHGQQFCLVSLGHKGQVLKCFNTPYLHLPRLSDCHFTIKIDFFPPVGSVTRPLLAGEQGSTGQVWRITTFQIEETCPSIMGWKCRWFW